jgi:hypothetical protein
MTDFLGDQNQRYFVIFVMGEPLKGKNHVYTIT